MKIRRIVLMIVLVLSLLLSPILVFLLPAIVLTIFLGIPSYIFIGQFECKVVDQAGQPIPNVNVSYEIKYFNAFKNINYMESSKEYKANTDEFGMVTLSYNRWGCRGNFQHPNYYSEKVHFNKEESRYTSPSTRIIGTEMSPVVLHILQPGVLMHKNSDLADFPLDLNNAPIEFGISFEENAKLSSKVNPHWNVEDGDIIVNIKSKNNVTIKGRNGWQMQLVPADFTSGYFPDHRLYEAPESGYKPELRVSLNQYRKVIFLSKDNGKQYGVLADLRLFSVAFEPENMVEFRYHYRVQAEPTGTRSLDPIGARERARAKK